MNPLGYVWLVRHFALKVRPLRHRSFVGKIRSVQELANETVEEHFVRSYEPGDDPLEHIVFALKYEGVDLDVLSKVFGKIPLEDIAGFVSRKPNGKYSRQIGCWYEILTGTDVPVNLGLSKRYIPLLDPTVYITASKPAKVSKWMISNNAIGDRRFMPMIRLTEAVRLIEKTDWKGVISETLSKVPEGVLHRALSYLYFKETRSSFAIEREEPSENRTNRFVALLHHAGAEDSPISEGFLAGLQNGIVDERFQEGGFRTIQNYIGHGPVGREIVDSIGAPQAYVRDVMDGLECFFMASEGVHPIIRAATVSFAFVFIHPFVDGNGRVHRYLIHDIMARNGIGGEGLILPVSAEILADRRGYDACLERFSRGLFSIAEWHFDDQRELVVENPEEISGCYRYPDLTPQVEYLAMMVTQSIKNSLVEEIEFLERNERAREAIRDVVDLPDRMLDSLLSRLQRNNGKLTKKRREGEFSVLTGEEIDEIEEVFQEAFIK